MDLWASHRWALATAAVAGLALGCAGNGGEEVVVDDPVAQNDGGIHFPPIGGDWETVDPASVGWSAEGLDAVLEYAREQRSSGLVVAHRGRILAEAYWEVLPSDDQPNRYQDLVAERTDDGRSIEDVASVQKSVVSFLVGVARGKGLLTLEDPVVEHLGEGWSQAEPEAEAAILVRHLLSMSTGLGTDRSYQAPAGEKWMYNTNVYSRTMAVLEAASGLTADQYTAQWLTDRIGMLDSHWGPRPWVRAGADANRVGFRTTASDLARFGVLVLAAGSWAGEDILGDATFLSESWLPSQPHNPSYGLLWWLNGQTRVMAGTSGEGVDGPLIPTAPGDTVAAQGALGRKLYVTPSLDLVVTRLGDSPARDFNTELWRLLMAAAPAGPAGSRS